jgi:predicted RNase H-like HicB family nuclease
MKNLSAFKNEQAQNRKFFWCDPQPIQDNNYLISSIQAIPDDQTQETIQDYPILIQYGEGSEAEVFLSEIKKVLTLEEYAKKVGVVGATLEEIQDNADEHFDLTLWDYPLEEYAYVLEEVNENVVVVETLPNQFRVCEY